MDKLKQTGKAVWNWTMSHVETVRSWFPPGFISSPLAKWIGGVTLSVWLAFLVVSFLYGDPTTSRLEIVQAVIAMLGLAGLAANAWFTLKRAKAIEEQVKVSDDAQITERFSRAIEHLGSDKPQIMIGGIYALERIAKDYQDNYHQTVMEVLTAFIRGFERVESVWNVPPEFQAAVTVVCRRDIDWEQVNLPNFELDLRGANLSHVQMQEAKLDGANLQGADLTLANLNYSDISNTKFGYADLNGMLILKANVYQTQFGGTVDFSLRQLTMAKNYQDAKLDYDIQAELDVYLKAKHAEANSVAAESNDPLDSVEDKLPDADVIGSGQTQDEPRPQQEDGEGSR